MNSVIHTLFPPRNTLFPYTTLFRSLEQRQVAKLVHVDQPTESKTPVEKLPSREAGLLQEPAPGNRRVTRPERLAEDRKSTRLNSSHLVISYAVFCLKKKNRVDASND